jgi:hypothetical protein
MVPGFFLTLAALQSSATPLPPSANVAVHEVVTQVEEALSRKDFAAARDRVELLPKREFVIQWDDSQVPSEERADFARMRDLAMQAWTRVYGLKPKVGPDGDLLIRFANRLPDGPQHIPSASSLDFGVHPRVTFTIGLKRGSDLDALTAPEEYVQVARAIGSYLGLSGDPLMGSAMWLDDEPGRRPYGPSENNFFLAQKILALADELKRDAQTGVSVAAGEPALSLTPSSISVGAVRQGEMASVELKLSNHGSAPLNYRVTPDCGCFSRIPDGSVPPGQTATLKTYINTTVWTGTQHKGLVLYSNDPQNPTIPIPVDFTSLPAYRLFRPEGDTVIVPKEGTTVDVVLTLPKNSTLMPATYEIAGVPATVTMAPWSGVVADPDMGEGPTPRQGYLFKIKFPGQVPLGRIEAELTITTGDKTFAFLQYPMYLQKGIVALPDNVSLGDMVRPVTASFRLSRHGKPFSVIGVATPPFLTAKVKPILGQTEYQVDVSYDGHAPPGDFTETIRVKTDDPKQPTIDVQFTGTVR